MCKFDCQSNLYVLHLFFKYLSGLNSLPIFYVSFFFNLLFCSLFAAQAGASKVIAVEASAKMAGLATQVIFFGYFVRLETLYLGQCLCIE